MKVLLVKPNNLSDHIQPSLGLGFLAEGIRARHEVIILDCIKEDIGPTQFVQRVLKDCRPDLVGIQCYTFDLGNVRKLLKAIKEWNPDIITVVGGAHISSDPTRAFVNLEANLDFAFAGEAEEGFPKFIDMLGDPATERDYFSIPGLIWKNDQELVANPVYMEEDLDRLGYPAWDLIRPDLYPEAQHGAFFEKFPIAPIITTRGCPYSCTFCSAPILSGKKLRHHSKDYVLRNISHLYHNYGIREFHIVDDNFTQDIEYAKTIVRGILSLNLDISLAMPNGIRMDYLDDELLELLKEAGLYLVSIAVESGNDEILKKMKKGTKVHKIHRDVKLIKKHGFDIAAFFILGFPEETLETIQDTIDLSMELPLLRANYFTYLPLPGTESYHRLEETGEIDNVDWDNFYMMDAAYTPPGIKREELLVIRKKAFLKFYLRPRVLIRNLLSIKNVRHFKLLFKRFYSWIIVKNHHSTDFVVHHEPSSQAPVSLATLK
ncbi:MAG: radical SAM protein [Nitrospinota bacterium]|nr:radical SAM protein [Nitrospinota bacterium]